MVTIKGIDYTSQVHIIQEKVQWHLIRSSNQDPQRTA